MFTCLDRFCRNLIYTLWQGFANFPGIKEPPSNSRCQNGDSKQFPHWKPTSLDWHVNLLVTWCFTLSASELVRIFVCKGNTAIIMLKIASATAQNLVAWATMLRRSVHSCLASYIFNFPIAMSTSLALGSGYSFCLTFLTTCKLNGWQKCCGNTQADSSLLIPRSFNVINDS